MCGLTQSTLMSVPVSVNLLVTSNSALVEWCAHSDPAAQKRPTARPALHILWLKGSSSFERAYHNGQWPAPATTSSKIQTFLATFPGPWGCLLTQDSQRPIHVMGRPPLLTFMQRSFEDSTAHRWTGSLMECAG